MGHGRMDACAREVQRGAWVPARYAWRASRRPVQCTRSLTCVQPVAWVPLDAIGQAYVDWVLSEGELPSLVNVVHPRPTTWEVVLRGVREELGGGVNIVSLGEWVAKLEARAEHASPQDLIDIVRSTPRPVSYLLMYRNRSLR